MIRVAICDDDSKDLETLHSLIRKYDSQNTFVVHSFSDSEQFQATWDTVSYDIVLLDIEMKAPTGYELGKRLKELNAPSVIIFVTKSGKYVLKGYGIAFRYLMKPVQYDEFSMAMDAAIAEVSSGRLSFSNNDGMTCIPINDILYVESYRHTVTVHTLSNVYELRQTLASIAGSLPRTMFISPHKGYLVNLRHIYFASSTEIKLSNGVVIPISRRKRLEFNTALNNYLGR